MASMAGFQFLAEIRDFSLLHIIRPAVESAQPPVHWVMGALSPEIQWRGHGADHSPPYSARVKSGGAIPPHTHTSSNHAA
jgi:hypothetical protein